MTMKPGTQVPGFLYYVSTPLSPVFFTGEQMNLQGL